MNWVLLHLLLLALLSVAFIPAWIVGCFEKKAIRMFDPCEGLRITAYLQSGIDRALANGFSIRCYGRHIKHPQTLFATLLLSSDRLVLALCSDGRIGSLPYSLTILMSRCRDGTI